mmetsp:Transcript_17342/g.31562  ORF Transcript_17342/g.31562 Transcript_17342/m.31562 type:complete len:275 (+) Transcript_17342:1223-2047(+)
MSAARSLGGAMASSSTPPAPTSALGGKIDARFVATEPELDGNSEMAISDVTIEASSSSFEPSPMCIPRPPPAARVVSCCSASSISFNGCTRLTGSPPRLTTSQRSVAVSSSSIRTFRRNDSSSLEPPSSSSSSSTIGLKINDPAASSPPPPPVPALSLALKASSSFRSSSRSSIAPAPGPPSNPLVPSAPVGFGGRRSGSSGVAAAASTARRGGFWKSVGRKVVTKHGGRNGPVDWRKFSRREVSRSRRALSSLFVLVARSSTNRPKARRRCTS